MRRWMICVTIIGFGLFLLHWHGASAEQAGKEPQKKPFGLEKRMPPLLHELLTPSRSA